MPTVDLISIVLHDERRLPRHVAQEVLEAKDGSFVGIEPEFMPLFRQLTIYKPANTKTHRGRPKFKCVVLYNRRRVRPDTLATLAAATTGELIGVDPAELDSFMPLVFDEKSLAKAIKEG